MSSAALLLSCAPLLPLLAAASLALPGARAAALSLAPWAALPALLAALALAPGSSLELPWLLLGSSLGIDPTGRIFLLFTAALWLLAGIYAAGYLPSPAERLRFFPWYLLAMAGNLGLILAQDMSVFYTFFALMSFASYGLVIFDGSADALRAGRVYIVLVVIGEVLLFAGFVLAARAAGGIEFELVRQAVAGAAAQHWIIGLVVLGFGIKAGLIGLHVWLPLAHPVAPTPASAVLSGAMIAAGLLGWLRVLPLGEAALPGWGQGLMLVGMGAVFYAVLVGVVQQNAKTVLAYSSISKMGILTTGVGLGLHSPQAWPLTATAIGVFALHHALAKGGLFLGVGMAARVAGAPRQRSWVIGGLVLLSLALAGAPLTSGQIAKQLFKAPLAQAGGSPLDWVQVLLTLSALATTLLMARFLYLVWPRPAAAGKAAGVSRAMAYSWGLLVAGVVVLPLFVTRLVQGTHWTVGSLLDALWPVATGAVAAYAAWRASERGRLPARFDLPPGDILVSVERYVYPVLAAFVAAVVALLSKVAESLSAGLRSRRSLPLLAALADSGAARLLRWNTAIALLLLLAVLVSLLLMR